MAAREDVSGVEAVLYRWGDECRRAANELGLPTSSGISRMIEQQKVFEGRRRGVRRSKIRLVPKPGELEKPEITARGTATRSFKPLSITMLSSAVVQIDAVIAQSPGWVQKTVKLSYLFLVRDSKAAEQLRIRRTAYTEQRAAAVEYVAERLALRAAE
jgi:hypothetical protein